MQKMNKKKKTTKILKIFTIALAIRKFQNSNSNSYKKTITYRFDKDETIASLKHAYNSIQKNLEFYLNDIDNFIYLIRKFELNFNTFEFVDNFPLNLINLIKTNTNEQKILLLCRLLKYLVKNNSYCAVDITTLIDFIVANKYEQANNEIVYSIGYSIEKDP